MSDAPDDRYLWDQGAQRDDETARLEALLGRYRYRGTTGANDFAFTAPMREFAPRSRWRRAGTVALAAALLVFATASWFSWAAWRARAGYDVDGLAGMTRAHAGERVETSASEQALLHIAELGDVRVAPGSNLRIVDPGDELHMLFLDRGALHATIYARPELFQIGTPAGLSIDLGCEYDLSVDEAGRTHVVVTMGRVAFEAHGRRVTVPAHAECSATIEGGATTPVLVDAPSEFKAAVRALECAADPDASDVAIVLAADIRDVASVSLWHLFRYAPSRALRVQMFERLKRAYSLPAGADERALFDGDPALVAEWQRKVQVDWPWQR